MYKGKSPLISYKRLKMYEVGVGVTKNSKCMRQGGGCNRDRKAPKCILFWDRYPSEYTFLVVGDVWDIFWGHLKGYVGPMLGHFGPFWVYVGPMLGHLVCQKNSQRKKLFVGDFLGFEFEDTLGHFGPFWVYVGPMLGHLAGFLGFHGSFWREQK